MYNPESKTKQRRNSNGLGLTLEDPKMVKNRESFRRKRLGFVGFVLCVVMVWGGE